MPDYKVNDDFVREFQRVVRKLDTLKGEGVTNNPTSISIGRPRGSPDAAPPTAPGYLMVKLLSNETGGGRYGGQSVIPGVSGTVSAAANLAQADYGTPATYADCLVYNPPEEGTSTHGLAGGTNTVDLPAFFTGVWTTETPPRKICILTGGGDTLPKGTAVNQVLQVTQLSPYQIGFDWVKGHA